MTQVQPVVNHQSSPEAKVELFRSLFRGRADVYPRRFESRKTGQSGYAPACANEWVRGICLAKEGLHPGLRNRLLRVAAFQNPEFYRAQAMRLSTKDMLAGRQQEIHAERDRKLEEARKQRQIRRQKAA